MLVDRPSTDFGTPDLENLDLREQLVNQRQRGSIQTVSIPLVRVTRLHGIMLDFDPDLYDKENPLFEASDDPQTFYDSIRPLLDRHPLARHAEVRSSGRGLHVLIWLEPCVELYSDNDQLRWDALVKVVQRSLPVDPAMPGITAMTRPLGSINSKNGKEVVCLREGEPVPPEAVESFARTLAEKPFLTLTSIHFGQARIAPCPVCLGKNSTFTAKEKIGLCYGKCKKVGLSKLMDLPFKTPDSPGKASK